MSLCWRARSLRATVAVPRAPASGSDLATREPFTGIHQAGIVNPPPAQATFVALDSLAPDQGTLQQALQALSNRARDLTAGGAVPLLEVDAPPADSGILGPDNAPDALTVTVSFGASLFDHRYGLAAKQPSELHIRLANPRTAATVDQRILRRGFNYHRGFDAAGQLDQGLVFIAFNRSPSRQFVPIQKRLNSEPMIDYITPVGGGYFFVPPGAQSYSDFVGSGLFG
jgi:deferrochelatase/peroxidase EfeB